MGVDPEIRIATLTEHLEPVDQHDSMAEAGRKILLADFIQMLQHEAGSRTGEDIEDVHQMRVATRRMRSALRLLDSYFKQGKLLSFRRRLRKVARALGAVRDLDVMIDDLVRFQETLEGDRKAALQGIVDKLDRRRTAARKRLIAVLKSKQYRTFLNDYGAFLTTPGAGAKALNTEVIAPYQVRHLLPVLIHEHLASVRAFDSFLDGADPATLHALRIEFKRLRYVVSFFTDVMGKSVDKFINELKTIQDHLGRLNDISVAREMLAATLQKRVDPAQEEVLQDYIAMLEAEKPELIAAFPAVWEHFNSRRVQRQLSDALLTLH